MVSMERTSEEEQTHIFTLLQDRDPAALPYLYKHAPAMEQSLAQKFRYIIAEEDLQDIVCDAIVQAFSRGQKFDPRLAGLKTWLNTIAHYQALTFLRKRKHMDPRSLSDLAYCLAVESALRSSMSVSTPSQDIEDLLQFIPERRAQFIREYYYEGRSFAEIAEQFRIREETVRVELSRGRDNLRKLMME